MKKKKKKLHVITSTIRLISLSNTRREEGKMSTLIDRPFKRKRDRIAKFNNFEELMNA